MVSGTSWEPFPKKKKTLFFVGSFFKVVPLNAAAIKSKSSRNWTLFICFPPPCPLTPKFGQYTPQTSLPLSISLGTAGLQNGQFRLEGPPNKDFFDFIERLCLSTVRVDVAFPFP